MSLAEMLTASAQVAGTAEGIVTVYALPPEAPPPDANLPAIITQPRTGTLTPGSSEMHDHTWQMNVLVRRGGNLTIAYTELLPFHERIVAAFRTHTTLGLPNTFGVHLASWEFGPVAYLDAEYLGITYTMRGKQKYSADYS